MRFIADLHIHSRFSRATSRELTVERLAEWAQLKGVALVGTGDFAHPGWFAELREKLVEAEPGLFRLNDRLADAVAERVPFACRGTVRFMLTVEISSIYKKGGRTRKVHNVVFVPGWSEAERLIERLKRVGNLRSDGRPILGLDSRHLLEMVLELGGGSYLVPAHIWTPHFAVLGSASGFDSIEECFDELTEYIFAVETGLSSDPPMNWRLSALDRFTLVSNSDAHSPANLGREATVFDTNMSFDAVREALRAGRQPEYQGTIEFYPQEGKYHYDGHRACGVCWSPADTRAHGGLCPGCGRPVTVGVMHRVEQLADRPAGERPASAGPYRNLIPLPELLAESLGSGPKSKRIAAAYRDMLQRLGPELEILQSVPLEKIESVAGPVVAEAIGRVRADRVYVEPGYDGVYGTIRVFAGDEREQARGQMSLFG